MGRVARLLAELQNGSVYCRNVGEQMQNLARAMLNEQATTTAGFVVAVHVLIERIEKGLYTNATYETAEYIMGFVELFLSYPYSTVSGVFDVWGDRQAHDFPPLDATIPWPDEWLPAEQPDLVVSDIKKLHDYCVEVQRRIEALWAEQWDRGRRAVRKAPDDETALATLQQLGLHKDPPECRRTPRQQVEHELHAAGIIEDPDTDGGLTG